MSLCSGKFNVELTDWAVKSTKVFYIYTVVLQKRKRKTSVGVVG